MQPTPSPSTTLPAAAPAAAMTASDLAELMSAFNAVTGRLQATHEQLRAEVARLTRELSEANEQLGRSKRLAALGEMAAGIAHEVRNPLGSISLFARMLKEDLSAMPEQQRIAEKILASAKGLNAVVGDVLTFSREFQIQPEPTPLCDLFDRAIESCRHDGVNGWESVTVVRQDREGPCAGTELQIDSSLVLQALTNLVRNAIEAMVETGAPVRRLTVGARRTSSADSRGNRRKLFGLTISDTGSGLSEEVLRRMFNPFFTTRKAGTGLGLAIVHRIMDAHGGHVVAANNSGTPGATVELLFPASAVVSAPQRADRAESSRVKSTGQPMGDIEQKLPLVAVAAGPDRRLSGAA